MLCCLTFVMKLTNTYTKSVEQGNQMGMWSRQHCRPPIHEYSWIGRRQCCLRWRNVWSSNKIHIFIKTSANLAMRYTKVGNPFPFWTLFAFCYEVKLTISFLKFHFLLNLPSSQWQSFFLYHILLFLFPDFMMVTMTMVQSLADLALAGGICISWQPL